MLPLLTSQKRRDELGYGGFSAAGGAYKRVHRSLSEGKVHAVQHLGVVVAEMYVAQLHGAVLRRLRVRLRARQLRRGENVRHLRDDSAYLGEIIRELHAADDGSDKPHGEYYNDDEFLRRERPVLQQQSADGQHSQESRGHDVHGKGEVKIALVHPVDIAPSAFYCG